MPKEPVTFRINPGSKKALDQMAKERGVTLTAVASQAVKEFLARQGFPRLTELPLNSDNPSPFKQPFLVLGFQSGWESDERWHVDVDGRIDLYIRGEPSEQSGVNRWEDATDLMLTICAAFEANGHPISSIGTCVGSGGPSHVLRNGAFFERISIGEPSARHS